jgi:hypothetical protein
MWSFIRTLQSVSPSLGVLAKRDFGKAGHGNDRVWEGWKAMRPASHPSHALWKSLRDYTFHRFVDEIRYLNRGRHCDAKDAALAVLGNGNGLSDTWGGFGLAEFL